MKLVATLLTALLASTISLHAQALSQFQVGAQVIAPATNPPAGTNLNVYPVSGLENPPMAIDGNSGTKYLNFGEINTGFLLTYASPVIANGLNLTTANDAFARDPSTLSLWGSTTAVADATPGTTFNLSAFTLIVNSQALTLPDTRLTAAPNVPFTNTTAYRTYLVVFPTVKDSVGANSMQIAEAVLTNAGAAIPTAGAVIAGGQLIPEPSAVCFLTMAGVGLVGASRRRS